MRATTLVLAVALLGSGTATAQSSCESAWQSEFPITGEVFFGSLYQEVWYSFTVTRPSYVTPTVQSGSCSRVVDAEDYYEARFSKPVLALYSECSSGGYMSSWEYGSTQQLLLTPGIYYFRFYVVGTCWWWSGWDEGGKALCHQTCFYWGEDPDWSPIRFEATARAYADVEIVPESINPRSHGVIPVALLGSEYLGMDEVDVSTLRFGPDEASPAHDLTDEWTYNEHLEDVNLDGFMDLMTHFRTQDTGIACSDTEATLTGSLLDGVPFEGTDSLVTVGCRLEMKLMPHQDLGKARRRSSDGIVDFERKD